MLLWLKSHIVAYVDSRLVSVRQVECKSYEVMEFFAQISEENLGDQILYDWIVISVAASVWAVDEAMVEIIAAVRVRRARHLAPLTL